MEGGKRIIIVRHGKAGSEDTYDILHQIGAEQCSFLGKHLTREGFSFDKTFVAPRRRHKETVAAVGQEFSNFGEIEQDVKGLDGAPNGLIYTHGRRICQEDVPFQETLRKCESEVERNVKEHVYLITRVWSALHNVPELESKQDFQVRIKRELTRIAESEGSTFLGTSFFSFSIHS